MALILNGKHSLQFCTKNTNKTAQLNSDKQYTSYTPSRFTLRERRKRRRAFKNTVPPDEDGASERPPPYDAFDVAIEYDEYDDDATDSTSSPSDSKFDDDLDF